MATNFKGHNYYAPSFEAIDKFYYNLNNTNTYNKRIIDTAKTNYKTLINGLKEKVETELKSSSSASYSSGGGSKPTHNTTTTNNATSKSKHNSSFKVSSSKTKGKNRNRSHTRRVK